MNKREDDANNAFRSSDNPPSADEERVKRA